MRPRLAFLVLIAAGVVRPSMAADSLPAGPEAEHESLAAFAEAHKDCLEWSDGCAVCQRGGGAFGCSTPGIACQPQALACRVPPAAK